MTTPADPHEEFEIAALRRARGALDADGVARLDAHLARCAACRGFAETAAATEAALRGHVRKTAMERDRPVVRATFSRQIRRRRSHIAGTFGVAALILLTQWWLTPTWDRFIPPMTATLVVACFILVVRVLNLRRALVAASTNRELLLFCRIELLREIHAARTSSLVGGTLAAVMALIVVRAPWDVAGLEPDPSRLLNVELALSVVCAAGAVYQWRIVLPRLERERRELDA